MSLEKRLRRPVVVNAAGDDPAVVVLRAVAAEHLVDLGKLSDAPACARDRPHN